MRVELVKRSLRARCNKRKKCKKDSCMHYFSHAPVDDCKKGCIECKDTKCMPFHKPKAARKLKSTNKRLGGSGASPFNPNAKRQIDYGGLALRQA